jgi:ribose transport system ATP-binding protein
MTDDPDTVRRAPALRAQGVTKTFNGVPALMNFDLEIAPGEVHALVGANGSGKSTFIKVLSGYHKPDEGQVEIDGELLHLGKTGAAQAHGCHFVHQDLGLIGSLTAADNVFLGSGFPTRNLTVRKRQMRAESSRLFGFVGLTASPAAKVASLTRAEQTLVAVARAMRGEPGRSIKLLVLDEPTATLPAHEVAILSSLVRRVVEAGVGVLYVSHRLDEIFNLADTITVLRDGHRRASSPNGAISRKELVNLVVGAEFDESHHIPDQGPRQAARARLQVSDLHAKNVHGVSFQALEGEILGIAGIIGSGRETLLRSIFAGEKGDRGTVTVDREAVPRGIPSASVRRGLAYLAPDRKTLAGHMDLTARENITLSDLSPFWRGGWLRGKDERREALGWFNDLRVRPAEGTDQKLSTFSGGNQQKIILARLLRGRPKVLLLDEPTQGVDVAAKPDIHDWMRNAAAQGATVLVSSSDDDELAAVCSRVLVIRDGRIAASITGARLTASAISVECVRVPEHGTDN